MKKITQQDMGEVLKGSRDATARGINCIQIGKIEKISDNQTCEVALQIRRRVPDPVKGEKVIDMPLLVDCPYVVLSGGKSYIDMPIQVGDYCLVLFNDRNIDLWWKEETVGEPLNNRKHSLSDGIALVGISPETQARTMDGDKVRIIGKSGDGGDLKAAARLDDEVKSTMQDDNKMWSWVSSVNAALQTLATTPISTTVATPAGPGTGLAPPLLASMASFFANPTNKPDDLTGKITSASEEVEIG